MKTATMYFMIAALIAVAAQAGEIVVRPKATPAGSVVRLGDLAEIRGVENGAAQRLASLPLLPVPAAGAPRFLRQRELQDLVAAHGEDMSQLRFTGATQVAIQPAAPAANNADSAVNSNSTKSAAMANESALPRDNKAERRDALAQGRITGIDPADTEAAANQFDAPLRSAIIEYLTTRSGTSDGWRTVLNLSDRQRATLATANSPLRCDGGVTPWTGKQRFVITFDSTDGPVKMPLLVDVTLTQPFVVAARPIARGALITAADLDVKSMDDAPAASSRRAPYHAIDELVGMEASRAVPGGEIIYTDAVAAPLLVKRGEAVTVIAQGGGIRVRTTARARQDGAHGDLVQVESIDSKERFDARVTGLKMVTVLAPAHSADQDLADASHTSLSSAADREPTAFRKYQPSPAAPSSSSGGKATAFRKLNDKIGKQNAQIR